MPKQAQAKTTRKNAQLPKGRSRNGPVRSAGDRTTDAEHERDLKDAWRALKEVQQEGSVPWEQAKRELGI